MTKLTTVDLRPFYSSLIGADRIMSRLSQFDTATQNQNYPPYNIIKKGENFFEVQIAVAGFDEGEIDIRVQDGNLIVTGEKIPTEEPIGDYLYHGISARKFIRTFALAEYVEVIGAVSKNGILIISLEHQIPESAKPKTIAITYQK